MRHDWEPYSGPAGGRWRCKNCGHCWWRRSRENCLYPGGDEPAGESWVQQVERRLNALEVHIQELAKRMNGVAL